MSAQTKIKTRCPVCKTAYHVPDSSVGHRARCPKCDSVFRVIVPGVQPPAPTQARPAEAGSGPARERAAGHPPTEDDIVGWLTEGQEKDDLPLEPRRWQSPPEPAKKASA